MALEVPASLQAGPPEFRIKRKPVSNPNLHQSFTDAERGPPLPPRPPLRQAASSNTLHHEYRYQQTNTLTPPTPTLQRSSSDIGPRLPPRPTEPQSPSPSTPSPSGIQKAYGEVTHFLGGLINHPTSSTKHYTILRHSHGVVFYRGSTTSVAISIFSSSPLPPDRTLWLQSKGWTGKTGMKAKALFRLHDDWLNVTPSLPVKSDQVDPADERAWQRDIAKFPTRVPAKVRDGHALRETAVVRIPVEAGDGYFQLVLCTGKKKVLCMSPVFRVLSTSFSPHSLRGASLSTLPLEVGAMVASLYAQATVQRFVGPVAASVQAKMDHYTPSGVKKVAGEKAWNLSGMKDRLGVPAGYQNRHSLSPMGEPDAGYLEQGPTSPFPMNIKARGDIIPDYPSDEPPRLNIKVSDLTLDTLHGYFFAWTRIDNPKQQSPWHQSILSITTLNPLLASNINITQTTKRLSVLRFLDTLPLPANPKLEIRIMGFIRADLPPPSLAMTQDQLQYAREAAAEAAMLADTCDASLAQSILDHPAWAPDMHDRSQGWMERTRDGVNNVRMRGQKFIEEAPLHWIGVRSATAEMKDREVLVNGFYIIRF
ncbi:hypothetical protein AWENTII_012025 [Aspergillus wentii]